MLCMCSSFFKIPFETFVLQVFRKIDRAFFMKFTEEQDMSEAYEDHAWRCGKLHLSAPCIYTKAMEALKLDQG